MFRRHFSSKQNNAFRFGKKPITRNVEDFKLAFNNIWPDLNREKLLDKNAYTNEQFRGQKIWMTPVNICMVGKTISSGRNHLDHGVRPTVMPG